LGIPEFEGIVEKQMQDLGIDPVVATEPQKQIVLKLIDDQIRLLWAGLIENQYMDSLNTVP
jgi:hypothetical protein